MLNLLLKSVLLSLIFHSAKAILPLVIWRGMGEKGSSPSDVLHFTEIYSKMTNGSRVYIIRMGNTDRQDELSAYIMPLKAQVDTACEFLRRQPDLRNGYNALGFAQGAVLLRGVAERCAQPAIHSLLLLCGPNMGVYGLPHCSRSYSDDECQFLATVLSSIAYSKTQNFQDFVCPAQYWRDPFQEPEYLRTSQYLALINNEKEPRRDHKRNFEKLKRLVLVKSSRDEFFSPPETHWFGFYKENTTEEVYTMRESQAYQENLFGLRTLDEREAIFFEEVNAGHCQFTDEWYSYFINKYFLQERAS